MEKNACSILDQIDSESALLGLLLCKISEPTELYGGK